MSEPRRCPYSGLSLLSCKVSDICDCFDFPEIDARAVEIIAERKAARTPRQEAEHDQHH